MLGHPCLHRTTVFCDLNNKKACIALMGSLPSQHIYMYMCALLLEGQQLGWQVRSCFLTYAGGKVVSGSGLSLAGKVLRY